MTLTKSNGEFIFSVTDYLVWDMFKSVELVFYDIKELQQMASYEGEKMSPDLSSAARGVQTARGS